MKFSFRFWRLFHTYAGLILFPFFLLITFTGWIVSDDEYFGLREIAIENTYLKNYYYKTKPLFDPDAKCYLEKPYVTFHTENDVPINISFIGGDFVFREPNGEWFWRNESRWKDEVYTVRVPQVHHTPSWFFFIHDIHTGRFFLYKLEWFYEWLSVFCFILSLSGFYLWYRSRSRRINQNGTSASSKSKREIFPYKYWRLLHRYVGLSVLIFFLIMAVTGFILIDENEWGTRNMRLNIPPLVRWYEWMFTKCNYNVPSIVDAKCIDFYTEHDEPVQISFEGGQLMTRLPNQEWLRLDSDTLATSMIRRPPHHLHYAEFVWDLHTGLLFNHQLDFVYEILTIGTILSAITGIYIWWVPWKRSKTIQKRKNKNTSISLR